MKNKKSFLFLISFICILSSVSAHGKKDIEDKQVENKHSWQESFPLDNKKAGKYNIMITAKDKGGNTYVEGPYNIYIDPLSDLPVCGITNPSQNMRIVGNLNIVGTCVDDDSVSYVELVLDGDKENPIKASGKEFWSYYLDTNKLAEGIHTIQVTGYDINGLASKPTVVSWHLDRSKPLTQIVDKEMGVLVSGNAVFQGTVEDGNTIKELSYSIDNGQVFKQIKIPKNKPLVDFKISVDTKKFPDGPAVIWFKAVDNSGSEGLYAFLYFIDNTPPDVQIIYPTEKDVMDGKFSVAGFAKDTIGIIDLTWTFGNKTGSIDLIPGNPYWSVNLDTIGQNIKSEKFTIKATDKTQNIVEVSKTITINQENDKPIVTISDPIVDKQVGNDEEIFVRGIAVDNDGVASVTIQLDSNEPIVQETKGVFYYKLCRSDELSAGNHKITVTATDKFGVVGNSSVVNFTTKGKAPVFAEGTVSNSREKIAFTNGMEIHPESNATIKFNVSSQVGLVNVQSEFSSGKESVIKNEVALNNSSSYEFSFPISPASGKGYSTIKLTATDSIGRTTEYKKIFFVTNTSVVKSDEALVVFDDSRIAEDGTVICSKEFPVSGYVLGANAVSVELVPQTNFVKATLIGNQIKLETLNASGSSEKITVRVRTDKGKSINSRELIFKSDVTYPKVTITNDSPDLTVDGKSGVVKIEGNVSSETGVGKFGYRILGVQAEIKNSLINAVRPYAIPEEINPIDLTRRGNFSVDIDTSTLESGVYVVEFIAESSGGNKTVKAIAISTIPDIQPIDEKMPVAKTPSISWINGYDVYAVAIYQGALEKNFAEFSRNEMTEGANPLEFSVSLPELKSPIVRKYTANKDFTLDANFALVNENEYLSGISVNADSVNQGKVLIYIDSAANVNSVNYEINGEDTFGGSNQKGSAKLTKPLAGESRWIAEIPLSNLPSRINKIIATVKTASGEKVIQGSVTVVRINEEASINDSQMVYCESGENTFYDEVNGNYVLSNGSKFYYYANVPSPVKVELVSAQTGLKIASEGRLIALYSESDGNYRNVRIRVTDGQNNTYESKALNFIADSNVPDLKVVTPELQRWVKNNLHISGTVADVMGVRRIEYSLDNGENWEQISIPASKSTSASATFSKDIDISSYPDGLIRLNVRAYDNAEHVCEVIVACYKDTTPPEVQLIEPLSEDIVNGENLIVFRVSDNADFEKAEYVSPPTRKEKGVHSEMEINHLSTILVGTDDRPINDAMSFEFSDGAGNKTIMESWQFIVDNQSDLPKIEIHVPDEDQVITRDFTVSGVVYDDDGECEVWYRIDRSEYKKIEKKGTNFAIDIPLHSMTDNEHSISVYAVDINGVKGNEVSRKFRVSLEEPKGNVLVPTIDTSVHQLITISGDASDKNGIEKVQISLDNGNSYNDAIGTEKWSYTVDTRVIPGGTQVVFLKITDKYGIQGLYSSLINIDNEAPNMQLELPLDDSSTTGMLFFSGYAFDNVGLTELYVTIRNLEKSGQSEKRTINIDRIIGQSLDITNLPNGFYNVELTGKDKAGNSTNVSRNIHLEKNKAKAVVDILYPLNGETKQGIFNIYGSAESEFQIDNLKLYIDDKLADETQLTRTGYYKFELNPEKLTEGLHKYRVDSVLNNGTTVASREQTITYSPTGPWITIDNFTYGDFAINRPYLRGQAGYSISEDELLFSRTKEATKEMKEATAAKKVVKTEISFDNGKTFTQISKNEKWNYRIENQDIKEGYHFLLLRATMKNGETAITRTIIQIDNTSPTIKLISPANGGRYNQVLDVSGLSNDDIELDDVTVTLRKGDKASYEIPSFIQGIYLDFHFWGATLFDIGAGFTAFNDVVKVQVQWGQYTQGQRDAVSNMLGQTTTTLRYGGSSIFGIKILANVLDVPFSFFFGHDWEWLSASLAVGANFSLFNETSSGSSQVLSALIAQLEFPKIKIANMKVFSRFSFYTEGSIWFIPTDTDITSSLVEVKKVVPQIAVGIRVNIF